MSKRRVLQAISVGLIVLGLSIIGGGLGAWLYGRSPNTQQQTENARRVAQDESQLISSIASTVGPSVVSVNVTSSNGRLTQQTAGTGFIISGNGYIVTNRHVVPAQASQVNVVLADGTKFDNVQVVGRTNEDDSLDVAFLKIADTSGKTLTPVTLGNSDTMRVGDMVVAIGNALGEFQNTVTSGIISGYGRTVTAGNETVGTENLQNLFQTDAAINQGNSGGPLVNANGEVIAINTAVAAGEAENIGFAIPINDALGLIKGIMTQGKLLRPYIGVRYVQLNADNAKELGLVQTEGAYISENSTDGPGVLSDSPAAAAGLRSKDVIVEVDGTKITATRPLTSVISRFAVGEKIKVTYLRDGKLQTADVTIKAAP